MTRTHWSAVPAIRSAKPAASATPVSVLLATYSPLTSPILKATPAPKNAASAHSLITKRLSASLALPPVSLVKAAHPSASHAYPRLLINSSTIINALPSVPVNSYLCLKLTMSAKLAVLIALHVWEELTSVHLASFLCCSQSTTTPA